MPIRVIESFDKEIKDDGVIKAIEELIFKDTYYDRTFN